MEPSTTSPWLERRFVLAVCVVVCLILSAALKISINPETLAAIVLTALGWITTSSLKAAKVDVAKVYAAPTPAPAPSVADIANGAK